MTGRSPLKLLVFGPDASEASQIRRMQSYLDCGFDVTGFTMRRDNMNSDFVPFWDNVPLGTALNESPVRRAIGALGGMARVAAHRGRLKNADVIVARNLDMLGIAAAARAMMSPRPPLIYECLDIHGLMTDVGVKGRIMRAAERFLLRKTTSLIVSSPSFVHEYFAPVQGWRGPVAVIENKLWFSNEDAPARPSADVRLPADWFADRPLVLGWVGTLRCARSLALLAEVAGHMGPRIRIAMHGTVHHHALPDFDATLAAHDNMTWYGPYGYPDGLQGIYEGCDLVWSQDLWQWGTNSTWLLPNRIYEASYFGCPSIAVAGSETGRRVADGLGWTIQAPEADALETLLMRLGPEEIAAQRAALLSRPSRDFRQSRVEIAAAIHLAL